MSPIEHGLRQNGEIPIGELTAEGVAVNVFRLPGTGDAHALRVIQAWPDTMDRNQAYDALYRKYGSRHELLGQLGPKGDLFRLCRFSSGYRPIISALGFRLEETTDRKDGTTIRTLDVEYPTAKRFNDFQSAAFPGEENVIFAEYQGGLYKKVDAMKNLAINKQWWIARDIPYQTDDAMHGLGLLCIGGNFLRALSDTYRPYVDLYDSGEKALKNVPAHYKGQPVTPKSPEDVLRSGHSDLEHLIAQLGGYLEKEELPVERVLRYVKMPLTICVGDTWNRRVFLSVTPSPEELSSFQAGVVSRFERARKFAESRIAA